MAKKFMVELYCESDARSIRNMIADVLPDGFIKSIDVVDDEAAQQPRAVDLAECVCPKNNVQEFCPVHNGTVSQPADKA